MSDIEGIVEQSVSGSCTDDSECLAISGNTRTKGNPKLIRNKVKIKPKHKGKYSERNCGKMQEALDKKHASLKLIKDPECNIVDEQEGMILPISCNCPCIKSYIKLINTLEICDCSVKKLKFNNTATKQDLNESEKQGFSAIRKERRSKQWKGTLKIITSSISLPFNLLKIKSNKKNQFLKTKYKKIFDDQQFLSGNDNLHYIQTVNKNADRNKLGASEIHDEKFSSQNDIREDHSSMSMNKILNLCKRNSIQRHHEDCDELINTANNKQSKNCKETRSSTIQDITRDNDAITKIQQGNEFHQTHSEIFSNLNKNDPLNLLNVESIRNKKSVNDVCEIPRKKELESKMRIKFRSNLIQKLNSLGGSQRRYVMGIRNCSSHNVKECIDKLLADMEYKSGSHAKLHKGLVCNYEGVSRQKSDVLIDGINIPKEISKMKQLLKDKILLHQQECDTSLYACDSSCKINAQTTSEKLKFQEIIKNYSDIMKDLETSCEKQDSLHNNQSLIQNISENFIHVDNSANVCIQPLLQEKNEKNLKRTTKSKLKNCNVNIEPIVEKTDRADITYSQQNFIQKNGNICDKEEILTLDSADSTQETKISGVKSAVTETIKNPKKNEFKIQRAVNKKMTRSKQRATKAWQDNQLTESDTTQSPNT